jgi:hypothetical protein
MKTTKNFWQKLMILFVLSLLTALPLFCETDDEEFITYGPLTETHLRNLQGNSWHMKQSTFHNAQIHKSDIYKRGDMLAIEAHHEGRTIRYVIRDGKFHIIVDQIRTVFIQDLGERRAMDFVNQKLSFVESGTARFNGKRNQTYEEYFDGETRVQFFVDKGKLTGIRQFDDKGKSTDAVVDEVSNRVPLAKFAIPTNYEIKDMSEAEEEFESFSLRE